MSLLVLTVTLHLVAMAAWVGTMVAVPAVLSRGPASPDLVGRLRGTFRLIGAPALLLTWAFGIANAVQSDAFDDTWLQVKLAFVLALSALHGVMSHSFIFKSRGAVETSKNGLETGVADAPQIAIGFAKVHRVIDTELEAFLETGPVTGV